MIYDINQNIKTKYSADQILSILENYMKKYNLKPEGELTSIHLRNSIDGNELEWVVCDTYTFLEEDHCQFYIISDKCGNVKYLIDEHSTYYPHLEKKEKTAEEIAEDEAFLQELRDEGFDIIE